MDIDIDFANRDDVLKYIKYINASIVGQDIKKHPVGVYIQNIPSNDKNQSTIDYKKAQEYGYFKIDLLNYSPYKKIKDRNHLIYLTNKVPNWKLLLDKKIVEQLSQVNNHHDLMVLLKPDSIEKLAAILGLIRPCKKHLIHKGWNEIFKYIWEKPGDDSPYFKKPHAIAYAHVIVMELNLIEEIISQTVQEEENH